jgi:hypothetical protein
MAGAMNWLTKLILTNDAKLKWRSTQIAIGEDLVAGCVAVAVANSAQRTELAALCNERRSIDPIR